MPRDSPDGGFSLHQREREFVLSLSLSLHQLAKLPNASPAISPIPFLQPDASHQICRVTSSASDMQRPHLVDEQAIIEAEVANGWTLRTDAVPSTLTEAERSSFALVPDATYLKPDLSPEEWYADWRGVVPGGAAWDVGGDVRSPWAVWTTRALLSAEECGRDVKSRHSFGLPVALRRLRSAPSIVSHRLITQQTQAVCLFALFPGKVRRVGRARRGAAARNRRLCVCWRQLGPLASPHGRPAAQRDTDGHGRGLRGPHEDEAGRPGVPS